MSTEDDISWFHGNLSRESAENLLKNGKLLI